MLQLPKHAWTIWLGTIHLWKKMHPLLACTVALKADTHIGVPAATSIHHQLPLPNTTFNATAPDVLHHMHSLAAAGACPRCTKLREMSHRLGRLAS